MSPKEPPSARPTLPSSMACGVLLGTSILAAWICGGITCYSVGVTGELSAKSLGYEQNAGLREIGWTLGIPLALVIMVLIPILTLWLFKKRNPQSSP